MESNRINFSELVSKRLDAEYYKKKYRRVAKQIKTFDSITTLENVRLEKIPIRRGIDIIKFVKNSDYPAIVTIASFEEPGINFAGLQRVDIKQHNEFAGSHIKSGDLLVAMGGYAGHAAICPPNTPKANIGRHTARIVIDPQKANKYYLWAFIRSNSGRLQFEREITGSIQPGINLEHLRIIEIPLPDRLVQNYIGDKVRLAEKLRERSKGLENHARLTYNKNLKSLGYIEILSRKIYSASLKDRLDPAYYSPEFTSIFDSDWFVGNSQPLGNFIAEGSYGFLPDSKLYGNGIERLLTASDIATCNYDSQAGVAIPKKVTNKKGLIKLNDILLEIKGAIEQCEIASYLAEGKYVNGSVFRFSVKNIPLGYLAFNLTGFIKQKYCRREAVNNMIQYLNIDTIRNLPIIRLDTKIEEDISNKYISAKNYSIISSALTTAAKYLVEALIEGKLTETELKNAQTALKKGDIEPDKAILAKLTRKGYDIADEPPLFPDLDALYQAIGEINL